MMTREENDRLCRIGPGTPMGALFRRFWMPIALAEKLPEPGGAPRHERLLGQDFVVFRSQQGKVGVLDELCMHRGASLVLGRVEDCGIRCLYHGWKFGTDGEILDIMNMPPGKRPPKLKANAYPVVEAGGIIWTYLGPADKQPPFPHWQYLDVPDNHRVVMRVDSHYNWVQATEGGLDSSHVSILHTNGARPGWLGQSTDQVGAFDDTGPQLELEETEFGYHYAAFRRPARPGEPENCRIVPFVMPSGRIIPGGALQGASNATLVLEIPLDDEHTATYSVRYSSKPVDPGERLRETGFDDPEIYSFEDNKLKMSRGDYKQNRAIMTTNFSGLRGIATEDAAIATSQGPIYDRSTEHLIASDMAVVRFRRRLLDSVDDMERGGDPVGVQADHRLIEAIDAPRPAGAHWRTLIPSHRVTAVDQAAE
jgi:phthalate 4,5-dioxygenase oxygenase subunit